MLNLILIWLLVILVHEWGHYITLVMLGHRPIIRIYPFVIQVGGNCFNALTLGEANICAMAGILSGLAFLLPFYSDWRSIAAYATLSSLDILAFIARVYYIKKLGIRSKVGDIE
jgi:hypothetical protein